MHRTQQMNVKVNIRSDRERKQENKLTRYVCTLFSAEGWYLCLYPLETIVSIDGRDALDRGLMWCSIFDAT